MPALEIIALDTTTPQLRAPSAADTYTAPRAMDITPVALTGSAATSSLSIAQTWNTTGTPTALDVNVTDTASNASSLLMNLRVGGTSRFSVDKTGITTISMPGYTTSLAQNSLFARSGLGKVGIYLTPGTSSLDLASDTEFGWGANTSVNSVKDTILRRDAANTLALRNGVNAQAFNIYNTFTDASNYERGFVRYSSNVLQIGHEAAGTGTATRVLRFFTGGTGYFNIGATNLYVSLEANRTFAIPAGSGSIEFTEAGTTVTAPAVNRVKIYAEDNGAGKTQLLALFNTGAAQVLATEP